MTDLDMTRLCAEAMGLGVRYPIGSGADLYPYIPCSYSVRDTSDDDGALTLYWPIGKDEQAMALVKMFRIQIDWSSSGGVWASIGGAHYASSTPDNLNRAIVECVAKMQLAQKQHTEKSTA